MLFLVDDIQGLHKNLISKGFQSVYEPKSFEDENGKLMMSCVKSDLSENGF